jgi:hypothetical protein
MTRDFLLRQTKPGIEVSVKPGMAHGELNNVLGSYT